MFNCYCPPAFQAVVSVVIHPCTRLRVAGCTVGAPLASHSPLSLRTLGKGWLLCVCVCVCRLGTIGIRCMSEGAKINEHERGCYHTPVVSDPANLCWLPPTL